jgi:hypothetical protein
MLLQDPLIEAKLLQRAVFSYIYRPPPPPKSQSMAGRPVVTENL